MLESQRALLGAAVVDAMLAPARARLAARDEADAVEPVQSLKQVSILFLDVVGSTTLSQHLDPEAISAVMDDGQGRSSISTFPWKRDIRGPDRSGLAQRMHDVRANRRSHR